MGRLQILGANHTGAGPASSRGWTRAARVAAYRELREALGAMLPRGSEVWVFGSVLKPGWFREDSDVDIAVTSLPAGQSEAWLESELALRLRRAVDVLNLNETGEHLRSKIKRLGERWTL